MATAAIYNKAVGARYKKSNKIPLQMGMVGPSDFMVYFPFINFWKTGQSNYSVTDGGTTYMAGIAPGKTFLNIFPSGYNIYFDDESNLISPSPASSSATLSRRIITWGSTLSDLGGYTLAGKNFVMKWDGHSVTFQGTLNGSGILTVTSPTGGTLKVGDLITGVGVPVNCTITQTNAENSSRTGTGGAGTYTCAQGGSISSAIPMATATWQVGFNNSTVSGLVQFGNRLTWTSVDATCNPLMAHLDQTDPPINVCICLASNEAAYDAGEVFDPEWLAGMKDGASIIRTMTWVVASGGGVRNIANRTFASLPTEANSCWCNCTDIPPVKGGLPLSLMLKLANQTNKHLWVNIPPFMGFKKFSDQGTITWGTTTSVSGDPNHNFVNGDSAVLFGFYGGSYQAFTGIEGTVSNVTSNSFDIGINSLTGAAWSSATTYGVNDVVSQSGRDYISLQAGNLNNSPTTSPTFWQISTFGPGAEVVSAYDLTDHYTEIKLIADYVRDNLNSGLVAYYELGNENWNGASFNKLFFSAMYDVAVARGVPFPTPGNNNNRFICMNGYLHANMMRAVRDSYGAANKGTKWRGILNTWTIQSTVTDNTIIGAKQLITDLSLGLNLSDLFDYISVAPYFGNIHSNGAYQAAVNGDWRVVNLLIGWIQTSIDRFNNGLESTKYAYYDRKVNEDAYDGRYQNPISTTFPIPVTGFFTPGQGSILDPTNGVKAYATANGLGMIGYEGGNGDYIGYVSSRPNSLDDICYTNFTGSVSGTNLTVTAVSTGVGLGKLVVNQQIIGIGSWNQFSSESSATGVSANTYILSQTSGTTGTTGVYVISTAQSTALSTAQALYADFYPLFREFFPQTVQTPAEAKNYVEYFKGCEAAGIVYPAKFVYEGPSSEFGAYGAKRYPGDNNLTWQVVRAFNLGIPPPV